MFNPSLPIHRQMLSRPEYHNRPIEDRRSLPQLELEKLLWSMNWHPQLETVDGVACRFD